MQRAISLLRFYLRVLLSLCVWTLGVPYLTVWVKRVWFDPMLLLPRWIFGAASIMTPTVGGLFDNDTAGVDVLETAGRNVAAMLIGIANAIAVLVISVLNGKINSAADIVAVFEGELLGNSSFAYSTANGTVLGGEYSAFGHEEVDGWFRYESWKNALL
jgi:hypothetical protein